MIPEPIRLCEQCYRPIPPGEAFYRTMKRSCMADGHQMRAEVYACLPGCPRPLTSTSSR